MFPNTAEEKLKERIKELECLYEISTIINQSNGDVKSTFQSIAFSLKKAWRFSDSAIVELKVDECLVLTDKLPQNTVYQYAKILLFKKELGYVKVHYPSPEFSQEHFLKEELILLFTIANDINAFYEKHLNKERELIVKKNAERVERLSILGEITAGIAHELNTPLGNILGFSELIAQNNLNDQVEKDLKKIISAALYSREIVKKLMFFSCEMPHSLEVIEIKPVITQVLSFLEPKFKKQHVNHELIFEDTTVKAQLDTIQFTQVLFNLLLNSLYVSPKDSIITISVTNDDVYFYIEVIDSGPGVPNDIKLSVFEPFFTTKPLGEGTGLGLSVVHGIIKSHKGEIIISDNNPTGAIFKIKLPLNL